MTRVLSGREYGSVVHGQNIPTHVLSHALPQPAKFVYLSHLGALPPVEPVCLLVGGDEWRGKLLVLGS